MDPAKSVRLFLQILKISRIMVFGTKGFAIFISLLRSLTCAFFLFTTITCLEEVAIKNFDLISMTHDALVFLLHILAEMCYVSGKEHAKAIMDILMDQPKTYPVNSVHSKIIQEYLKRLQLFCKLMWLDFFVVVLWSTLSYSRPTPAQSSNKCVQLSFGHIWYSTNPGWFIMLNIACVLSITFTMFQWYLSMFLMVSKIKCQIRLLCTDLQGVDEKVKSLDTLSRADDTKKNVEARRKFLKSQSQLSKVKENEELLERNSSEFRTYFKIVDGDKQVKAFLKDVVEQHIDIIKNVQLTEKTYRYSILFFTQIVVILMALAIPQLRINADILSPAAFKLVVVVMCESLGNNGLFNYSGQVLLDESEELRQALYNCDWTDKPHSLRRGLLIMQIMASKPLKLTTGGIYTLSMETFASVLSATYSYSRITHSFKYE